MFGEPKWAKFVAIKMEFYCTTLCLEVLKCEEDEWMRDSGARIQVKIVEVCCELSLNDATAEVRFHQWIKCEVPIIAILPIR